MIVYLDLGVMGSEVECRIEWDNLYNCVKSAEAKWRDHSGEKWLDISPLVSEAECIKAMREAA